MTNSVHDAIVIGGGLHGLSSALHLARSGMRVALLEKSWLGRHASGGSAAGVRTLNRALEELPIALEAIEMWHSMEALVGDDCGFHAHGQIQIAVDPDDVRLLERRLEKSRAAGFNHEELIDADELHKLVPALSRRCSAGLMVRRDGAADPHRTLIAFRRAAELAGVLIKEECPVTRIERIGSGWRVTGNDHTYEAPNVINAAGAWSDKIAAMIGEEVSLGHKASMMIVTERIAPFVKPVVGVAGRPLSFKQTDQGTLLIGGGLQGSADLDRQESYVDFLELSKVAATATELFPSIGCLRIVRTWAGMEAKTHDLLPVIGPSAIAQGIFHAFGFSGHGFELVPVVGAIIADLVIDGGTNRKITDFSAGRLHRQ
ncbi:NAD(P)/FAD-dependent oxidoreductase [Celeribacter sp.]|uniref:NAD(P)/FAD-dependent oxidoreductase n=1 Tax=Celeribacter sp. TaxID=1890673 RepID=UPI003A92D7D9